MRLVHWFLFFVLLGCGVNKPLSNSGLAGRWILDTGDFVDFAEQSNEATVRGGAFDLLENETIPTVSINEIMFEYRRVD